MCDRVRYDDAGRMYPHDNLFSKNTWFLFQSRIPVRIQFSSTFEEERRDGVMDLRLWLDERPVIFKPTNGLR